MSTNQFVALAGSETALIAERDLLLLDLDGVVYLADEPIEHAAQSLAQARSQGVAVRFVTNNAARTPAVVAEALARLGVPARPEEVMTSAVAAAQLLATRYPAGTAVLVVGGDGVREALHVAGLRPVDRAEEQPAAILQGFAPQVGWSALAEAAVALRAGAVWMATNVDRTLPSPRGPLPGNGSLVAALVAATGLEPESVGKPAPALYDAALRDGSRARTLAVGDRLDTDIAGARAAGVESLLVLTGVSSPADLIAAPREQRPNFVGRDLRDLLTPHLPAIFDGQRGGCDAAVADLHGGGVVVHGGSGLDQLRAICALAWSGDPVPRGGREAYQSALEGLDLD